jgi:16S rRNA (cytidine1402-2'-O)-methyltransferase
VITPDARPGLAICATPIGNLEDVTLRVLAELRDADLVLCEDTRHTRILLDRHGISARQLMSYHQHNEASRVEEILPRLRAGERIALVSDAGLPGVNDPGARVIAAALAEGLAVTVLPGASAVETALVASGLAGEQYRFVGYLPRRRAELQRLWAELAGWAHPTVAFESPKRLPVSLASLAEAAPDRRIAVCRELTKRFEEVVSGTAQEVAGRFATSPKGEVTLVIGGVDASKGSAADSDTDTDSDAAIAAVVELLGAGATRRTAVDVVAGLTGLSRRSLYRASL